jgi:hypothetical protein
MRAILVHLCDTNYARVVRSRCSRVICRCRACVARPRCDRSRVGARFANWSLEAECGSCFLIHLCAWSNVCTRCCRFLVGVVGWSDSCACHCRCGASGDLCGSAFAGATTAASSPPATTHSNDPRSTLDHSHTLTRRHTLAHPLLTRSPCAYRRSSQRWRQSASPSSDRPRASTHSPVPSVPPSTYVDENARMRVRVVMYAHPQVAVRIVRAC